MNDIKEDVSFLLSDFSTFCEYCSGITLRSYQRAPAENILHSIYNNLGYSFVIILPRQSGKNEFQAQFISYLLLLFSSSRAEIVSISPTWRPQCYNAMARLDHVLSTNFLTSKFYSKSRGHIFHLGMAKVYFLSGSPTSSVVGLTASTLLSVDEAQDIEIIKYDKEIAPMAASTNATRLFFGTAWTDTTLLAREYKHAKEQQQHDNFQRVWRLTADVVGAEVPTYKSFVQHQVKKLGRNHPMVRTQYFSEDISADGGLFPFDRIALMYGSHPALIKPDKRRKYIISLDFAGEDENPLTDLTEYSIRRDSTALTIAAVNKENKTYSYSVVFRKAWVGIKHHKLFDQLVSIISLWSPGLIICDSTGVGAGISSFLSNRFPNKVLPFIFSSKSKSDLGWRFLSVVDAGLYQDYSTDITYLSDLQSVFFNQLKYCTYEIIPGPSKTLRWSVPDGTKDLETDQFIHDDFIISAAMLTLCEDHDIIMQSDTLVVPASDPLDNMRSF
jgi:hypothetical protein